VIEFVRLLLASTRSPFVTDIAPFAQRVGRFGLYNSLTQVLLKFTAPGVPDCYQGCDVWDFSLVDPDNRRPVDYGRRSALLNEILDTCDEPSPDHVRTLLDRLEDGRIKLYLTWRLLALRAAYVDLFQRGSYLPLATYGAGAEHLIAFARHHEHETFIVVAPRWFARLPHAGERPPLGAAVWGDTGVQAPPDSSSAFRNILTGEILTTGDGSESAVFDAASLFASFPVAALMPERIQAGNTDRRAGPRPSSRIEH
jgi:maltooligosyltrehalose synthase